MRHYRHTLLRIIVIEMQSLAVAETLTPVTSRFGAAARGREWLFLWWLADYQDLSLTTGWRTLVQVDRERGAFESDLPTRS